MEGAPGPLLYPLSPANPVVMNVVSQFTVYDLVLGVWRQPGPSNIVSIWTRLRMERGRQEEKWESQGYYRRWQIQLHVINNFLY